MKTGIYPIGLHFQLPLSPDKSVERLVHTYLVLGEQICLVDTGVSASYDAILGGLAEMGISADDVAWVVNTHAHPDHMGCNLRFQEDVGPKFACHSRAARWIEDVDVQFKERPLYGFETLVGGSVQVTRHLEEGDEIDLGGITLQVLHTPGHSPGSISLFCPQDGTLLTGDAIPPTGGLPLYYDLGESRRSLHRLSQLENVKTLYQSHLAERFEGPSVAQAVQGGLDYLDRMDEFVAEVKQALPADAPIEEMTRAVLVRMGFDPPPVMPLTITTVRAHLA